jgi:hypothetical protein
MWKVADAPCDGFFLTFFISPLEGEVRWGVIVERGEDRSDDAV